MSGFKIAVLADQEKNLDDKYNITNDVVGSLAVGNHAVLISGELYRDKGDVYDRIDTFPYRSEAQHQKDLSGGVDIAKQWRDVSSIKSIRESLERRADIAVLTPGAGVAELSEAVYMARRGTPLIVLNNDGYFDGLETQVEQVRETLSVLNDNHGAALQDWDHISFVTKRSSVIAQVEQWKNNGLPVKDKEERRHCEHNAHILMKSQTGENQVDYTVHHGGTGRAVGTLLSGSTLEGLDRLLGDMTEHNAVSVIDNTDRYHNGILMQFDKMIEDGVETYDSTYGKIMIAENKEDAHRLVEGILHLENGAELSSLDA